MTFNTTSVNNKYYLKVKLLRMETKVKWYNDIHIVGSLLFFIPPMGIYGVYRSETIQPLWKKVTYASVVIAMICILWNVTHSN